MSFWDGLQVTDLQRPSQRDCACVCNASCKKLLPFTARIMMYATHHKLPTGFGRKLVEARYFRATVAMSDVPEDVQQALHQLSYYNLVIRCLRFRRFAIIENLAQAANKAMANAERRRKLAAHICATPVADEGCKRERVKTTPSKQTPSCQTPAPKHAKNDEGDGGVCSPVKLFATPAKGSNFLAM